MGRKRNSNLGSTKVTPKRAGSRTPLVLLFVVSLLVRLAYLLQIRDNPTFAHPTADALLYNDRALDILGGDLLGQGIFFHSSPIYPLFLSANYLINGQSIFWTYCAQAAIDSGTVLLLWLLANRLFGRGTAWATAFLAAFYQAFLFFAGEMLEITLVLFAVTASVLLLVIAAEHSSKRTRLAVVSGVFLGLAALGKPNILATIPFLLAGWKWQRDQAWRLMVRPTLLFGIGVALVILPVTLRNLVVGDDLVLTSSNGGINFFIGHNDLANGIFRVGSNMEADLEGSSTLIAERALERELKPSQVSNYWFRQGIDFMSENPARELTLLGRKFLLVWNGYEIPNHFDLNFFERYSSVLRFTPVRFATAIPLAMAGLFLAWPRRRQLAIPLLFIASYLASVLLFFVTARYRLPAVPFLLVFSGYALMHFLRLLPGRWQDKAVPPRSMTRLLVGLVVGIVLVQLPMYKAENFYAAQHASIGSVYKNQGRFDEAVVEYQKAVELGPSAVLFRNSLGVCLLALDRAVEGEEAIRSALAIDPGYAPARRNISRILEERGDITGAIEEQKRAFSADPSNAAAGLNLGRLLSDQGSLSESESVLRTVLQNHPENSKALWNLAVLLGTGMNRPDEALIYVGQLQRVDPNHPRAGQLRAFLESNRKDR